MIVIPGMSETAEDFTTLMAAVKVGGRIPEVTPWTVLPRGDFFLIREQETVGNLVRGFVFSYNDTEPDPLGRTGHRVYTKPLDLRCWQFFPLSDLHF